MKSVRLTDSLRQEIVAVAMKGAFETEMHAAMKALHDAGMAAYNAAYTEDEMAMMQKLGPKFLGTRERLRFAIRKEGSGPGDDEIKPNSTVECPLMEYVPVPFQQAAWGNAIITTNEAHANVMKAIDALDKVKEQVANLKREIRSVVGSVPTTKRLVEVWPEAINYLPKEDAPPTNLPAVQIEALNALLAKAKVSDAANQTVKEAA